MANRQNKKPLYSILDRAYRYIIAFVIIVTISNVFYLLYSINTQYKKRIEEEKEWTLTSTKKQVKTETMRAYKYIKYREQNSVNEIKQRLIDFVNEKHKILESFYSLNKDKLSDQQILDQVKELFRNAKPSFSDEKIMITSLSGESILFPDNKDKEGNNIIGQKDYMGNYVIQREIDSLKKYDDYAFEYSLDKDEKYASLSKKISYVKAFRPLNIYLGSVIYTEDYIELFKKDIIEMLSSIRFNTNGYIFLNTLDGKAIITNGEVNKERPNIWHLTDPDGVKVIQEEYKAAQNPEGDFIYYKWKKLSSDIISKKVSFIKAVPEFNWMIGSGAYLDEIDKLFDKKKAEYSKHRTFSMIWLIFIIAIISGGIIFIIRRYFKITNKYFNEFKVFLNKAGSVNEQIDTNLFRSTEFSVLAEALNKMIREKNKITQDTEKQKILYDNVINSIPDLIYYKSIDGKYIGCNKAFEKFIGRSIHNIIGKTNKDFFDEEIAKRLNENDKLVLKTRKSHEVEEWIYANNGQKYFFNNFKTTYYNQKGELLGILGISRNITEKEKMYIELTKAHEKVKKSDLLKTSFLTNLSHEIRTPMNSIIGFSTILLEEKDIQPSEQKEYFSNISTSAINLLNILESILDISMIESNEMTFFTENIKVSSLIHQLSSDINIHRELEYKNIKYEEIIKISNPDICIKCDKLRLTQAINHIIDNAFKFNNDGEVIFIVEEIVDKIIFTIKDTGIGIPKEQLNDIFEKFVQINNSENRKHHGTGVGLSISKYIIENSGGQISVESEINIGTTFRIILPINDTIESSNVIELKKNIKKLEGKKILIVEDIETNYQLLKVLLNRQGAITTWVENGQEAVDYIKNNTDVDMILMDIQMPVMTGLEATKIIRGFSDIPIIAVSAYTLNKEKEQSIQHGCNDYISKPVKQRELMNLVCKYL